MALRQISRLEIAQNTFLPTLGEVQVIMFRTSLPGLHLTCKILWPWWIPYLAMETFDNLEFSKQDGRLSSRRVEMGSITKTEFSVKWTSKVFLLLCIGVKRRANLFFGHSKYGA